MLLILFSWLYIFYTTITLGFYLNKLAKLKCDDSIVLSIFGFFSVTLIASFCALFGRINVEFHIFLLVINFILSLKYKSELFPVFQSFLNQINELSKGLKIFLFLTTILILAQCASTSNIIDNETYYIQTIKWLNEYGFVKGLANLHVFLGQTSGWHITQSVFNFSFLYQNFNDINGLYLLLVNVFVSSKLNRYWKTKNQLALMIGLLPLANLFLFQFIGAPSPDLAIYVISFLLFYYFLKDFDTLTIDSYNLIFILSCFLVYIKVSAFPILMIPLVLFILNFKKLIYKIYISYIVGILTIGLFIAKNLILTGYPFFPSPIFKDILFLNYALPSELYTFSFSKAKLYEFMVLKSEYNNKSAMAIFLKWLFYSKIDSLFNISIIASIFTIPYFLRKYLNKTAYWFLYMGMLLQLAFLILTSPQYRFIIHFVLFFGCVILSCVLRKKQLILYFFYVSLIPIVYFIVVPIKSNTQVKNKLFDQKTRFSVVNIFIPHKNSNLVTQYQLNNVGNLDYYSPNKKIYFWISGDGPLPCVNEKQLLYFEKKLGYVPQKRTKDIKDGFYSKKITVK